MKHRAQQSLTRRSHYLLGTLLSFGPLIVLAMLISREISTVSMAIAKAIPNK
jgi:hypothetical protein